MPFEFTPEQRAVRPTVDETYIRTKLAEADEAITQGNIGAWDPAAVKAEARRRQ